MPCPDVLLAPGREADAGSSWLPEDTASTPPQEPCVVEMQVGDAVFVQLPGETAMTPSTLESIERLTLPTAINVHTVRGAHASVATFLDDLMCCGTAPALC